MPPDQTIANKPLLSGNHRGTRKFACAIGGTMVVELGLLMPILMMMMMGIYEASVAISNQMLIQNATRAATQHALNRPPVQGDLQPILDAAKQTLPTDWTDAQASNPAEVSAALVCQCETTGTVACGSQCSLGERKNTYISVTVTKTHDFLFDFANVTGLINLGDTTMIRMQ